MGSTTSDAAPSTWDPEDLRAPREPVARPSTTSRMGPLTWAILTWTLAPLIVLGIAGAVGYSAVSGSGNTIHELAVDTETSLFLTAGEYQVLDLDARAAQMTVRPSVGSPLAQEPIPVGETRVADGKTYSVLSKLTLPSNGYYTVRVETPGRTAGVGTMAIGPSTDELARKFAQPMLVGGVIAALLVLGGLLWTVLAVLERGRAKRRHDLGDPTRGGAVDWPKPS